MAASHEAYHHTDHVSILSSLHFKPISYLHFSQTGLQHRALLTFTDFISWAQLNAYKKSTEWSIEILRCLNSLIHRQNGFGFQTLTQ